MSAHITFNPAAFKHGVTEADIRRAVDIYIYEDPLEDYENKYLLLGYDTKGTLLEIVYNIIEGDNINVFHSMPCRRVFYARLNMAAMTDEEADALDELLTRTTPKIRAGEGGLLTRQRNLLNALDPAAANYIRSQAEIKHLSPAQIIGDLVREKIEHEAAMPVS